MPNGGRDFHPQYREATVFKPADTIQQNLHFQAHKPERSEAALSIPEYL